MREREVKLSAGEDFRFPDLSGLWEDVVAAPRNDERLSTVYFDSDDLRLARWGLSFRYRDGQGWTVKLPDGDSGVLLVRGDVFFQGSRRTPPPGAIDLVKAISATPTCIPKPACARFAAGSGCRTANGGW